MKENQGTAVTVISKKTSAFRFLVVDSNKCFASIAKEQIEGMIPNSYGDVAVNIWELRLKLNTHKYKFIIADTSVATDSEEMRVLLGKSKVPAYYWSPANSTSSNRELNNREYYEQKPATINALKETINKFVVSE